MLLLAFDTATPAITVALSDGAAVLAESAVVDAMRHGEMLVPGIERVLRAADVAARQLTDIAVGVGPGPFTGLRVGLVTARAMGDALAVPVHGVCTLDVLAADADVDEPFLVATDARRREVYWARYDVAEREDEAGYAEPGRTRPQRDVTRVDGPRVSLPQDVPVDGLPAVGGGAFLYRAAFGDVRPPEYPSAGTLAVLVAKGVLETRAPLPMYLRRPHVAHPGTRKSVTPAAKATQAPAGSQEWAVEAE